MNISHRNASHGNNEKKNTLKKESKNDEKIYILKSFYMNVNFQNFCINTFSIYEQIPSDDKDMNSGTKNKKNLTWRWFYLNLKFIFAKHIFLLHSFPPEGWNDFSKQQQQQQQQKKNKRKSKFRSLWKLSLHFKKQKRFLNKL